MYRLTASQVFLIFLKNYCTIEEYLFFRHYIIHDCGNRFFTKRRIWRNDKMVESYLSNHERTLVGFMKRLFILAPNLVKYRSKNSTWKLLILNKGSKFRSNSGIYVNYYHQKWKRFLFLYIGIINKPFYSRYRKGEENYYYYKK